VQGVEAGRSYPDVLYRLGLSHLGAAGVGPRQKSGWARAVELKARLRPLRASPWRRCAIWLAQHAESVDQIDAVLALPVKQPDARGPQQESDRIPLHAVVRRRLCDGADGDARDGGRIDTKEALAASPTDLFAHHRLAAIYLAHNQLEESVAHHRAILDAEPQEGDGAHEPRPSVAASRAAQGSGLGNMRRRSA